MIQLEKDRDATREEFAKAANALKAKLDGFSSDLLKLGESSPEDGLKGLESVNENIAAAKEDVAALKEIDARVPHRRTFAAANPRPCARTLACHTRSLRAVVETGARALSRP